MNRLHSRDSRCGRTTFSRGQSRRGTIIVVAMVILLVFMAIGSTLIGSVLQTRTQLIREEQFLQTSLLVEAGLRRGFAQLRNDAAYKGETWQIDADLAASLDPATVVIVVGESDDQKGERVVSATAEYPAGTPNPIRITHELSVSQRESP